MQATRSELSRTAAAQEKSVYLLNEQISAQRLEKFENTFFSLKNQLNHSKPDGEIISIKLEECFRTSHIKRVRDAVHEGNHLYGHYYRLIFQILKFIAYSTPSSTYRIPSVQPPSTEEKFYAGILRSVLDHGKTQILAINACCLDSSDSFFEYMALIKRYSLLEHMPFEIESANKKTKENSLIYFCSSYFIYRSDAFNKNIFLKQHLKYNNDLFRKGKISAYHAKRYWLKKNQS